MPDIDFPTLASANAEADRLLAEMPEALAKWMADQKLTLEQSRPETADRLRKHWEHVGCAREADSWVRGQSEALRVAGVTASRKVAKRVTMRFARAKFLGFKIAESDDTEWMPPTERWVAKHPALSAKPGTPPAVVDAESIEYEKHNPCPGPYASNMLNHCRKLTDKGESKNAEAFFTRLARLRLEAEKIKKMDANEQTERKRVLDMKAELAKMKAKASA